MFEGNSLNDSIKSLFSPLTTKKAIIWIFIIGFAVFFNMLSNNFVWDDKVFIISNPEVHSINIPLLFGKNLFNDTVYYRPIPALYSAVLYTIFSVNSFPYHLLQLLIHIACTILLFILFTSFFKKYISFLLALIFLVHPMQVESVSSIAQTVSPLFFLFGISALLLTIKKQKKFSAPFIGLLLLLSLLTKETGLLFVLLVGLYTYLYKKSEKIGIFVWSLISVVVYFLFRFGIGNTFFARTLLISPISSIPIEKRLFTIPDVALYYLKTFIFPLNLSINQHWVVTSLTLISFYIPFLTIMAIVIAMILVGVHFLKYSKDTFKRYIFFFVWVLLGFAFHLQLVPLDMTVADRWFYFTIAGLLGFIGILLDLVAIPKRITITIIIALLVLLSVRTVIRNTDWKNAVTLYSHDMQISNNFELENNLGWELIQEKSYKDAVTHLRKSTEMMSTWDRSWYNLGVAYHFSGDAKDAKSSYEKALTLNKNNIQVIENLSYLLLFYYDPKDAEQMLVSASKKFPNRPKLWYFLALASYKLGEKDESIKDIEKAYSLNPTDQDIAKIRYFIRNNKPINFQQ